ncbi:MAG: peptide chain release factor N(5)-glutamine methyltransferase [Phycisphaerae bacterium]|nr:peptide chain release factor N(5)-glutamine methyltransferase [Gemmatimonadaceae bacterium]
MSDVRAIVAGGEGRASTHTIRALLAQLTRQLQASPTLTGADERAGLHREAREILATLLHRSLGEVSRGGDHPIDGDVALQAFGVAARRATGEPLAYCLGSAAFRHLELAVDSRVLIPRPETEIVVEQALKLTAAHAGGVAVDIGTGSGAIALSLATEGRFERVIATDISADALDVAAANADLMLHRAGTDAGLGTTTNSRVAPIEFRLGADFEPLGGIKARVIVSNPPYIAWEEAPDLPASVRDWEPHLALFADDGGMARYDVLLAGAPSHLAPGGWLVLEVDSRRATETARRATLSGLYENVQLIRDLTNRDRVLIARVSSDIT